MRLNRLYMNEVDGVLTIGVAKTNTVGEIPASEEPLVIFNTGESFEIVPKEIGINELKELDKNNILIKVLNVELMENELGQAFAYYSGEEMGFER